MQHLRQILKYDRVKRDVVRKLGADLVNKLVEEGVLIPDPSEPEYFIVRKRFNTVNPEKIVKNLLSNKCMTLDEIVMESGLDEEVVRRVLEKMVLSGKIHLVGDRYCRGTTRITRRRGYGKTIVIEI